MSEFYVELIGFMAGFCMAITFIPQSIKTIRTKDTKSISLISFMIYNLSCILWFVYGVLLGSYPMMIFNVITFVFAFTILILKIKHG